MNKFFKTALIAAALIAAASPLQAGQYVTHGFGTAKKPLPWSDVQSILCHSLLQGTFKKFDVWAAIIEQGFSFGTTTATALMQVECREHESLIIGQAVSLLQQQDKANTLPEQPTSTHLSDNPKIREKQQAVWAMFDKWLKHQGPRPAPFWEDDYEDDDNNPDALWQKSHR